MDKVKIGLVGFGNMGREHARSLMGNKVNNAELAAVCDIEPERLEKAKEMFGEKIKVFDNAEAMYESNEVNAAVIATPHYDHPPLAVKALNMGLHTLIEKPAGVYTRQVREMNETAAKTDKVFGIMYNQRTNPIYQKLRELIKSGELGDIKRTNWIIDWYRPQSYYDSGGWRATWAGEGGGVLLNQDPHQLDLWQWMCGMPSKVRGFCACGKYHNIEVDDDVTAYVEYENGATGLFVSSTGMTPETNRLEVMADRGKVVIEKNELIFYRNRIPERQFNAEFKGGFGGPENWVCKVPVGRDSSGHVGILRNWVSAILNGTGLLAPGEEGIKGLQISNAIHLSSWLDKWVDIPVNEDLFYEKLQEKIKNSSFKKNVKKKELDTKGTY